MRLQLHAQQLKTHVGETRGEVIAFAASLVVDDAVGRRHEGAVDEKLERQCANEPVRPDAGEPREYRVVGQFEKVTPLRKLAFGAKRPGTCLTIPSKADDKISRSAVRSSSVSSLALASLMARPIASLNCWHSSRLAPSFSRRARIREKTPFQIDTLPLPPMS